MESLRLNELFELSGGRDLKYERPDFPLEVQEGPRNGAIPVPDEEREALLEFAAWREDPPFDPKSPGRSGAVLRRETERFGGADVAGYKLKGVGNFDPKAGLVTPPSDQQYVDRMRRKDPKEFGGNLYYAAISQLPRILVHRGISETGAFYPVLDPPKPLGGMPSGRGYREFENTKLLYEAGVSACGPVTWGRYPGLLWNGEPMEFVALSLPNPELRRLGEAFNPVDVPGGVALGDYMRDLVDQRFDMYDPRNLALPAAKLTASLGRAMGRTLRNAHEAGLCRFAGHMGNYSYNPNTRGVVMHDFDSSVTLDSLDPRARSISMIRDIESALIGLTHSVAFSNLFYLLRNPDRFDAINPVGQILRGYFDEDNEKAQEVAAKAANQVSKEVIRAILMRGEFPPPAHQNQWLEGLSGSAKIFLALGFDVYSYSDLAGQAPLPYGIKEMVDNLERFERESQILFDREKERLWRDLPDWVKIAVHRGF